MGTVSNVSHVHDVSIFKVLKLRYLIHMVQSPKSRIDMNMRFLINFQWFHMTGLSLEINTNTHW
jgi:hypothetical protein